MIFILLNHKLKTRELIILINGASAYPDPLWEASP